VLRPASSTEAISGKLVAHTVPGDKVVEVVTDNTSNMNWGKVPMLFVQKTSRQKSKEELSYIKLHEGISFVPIQHQIHRVDKYHTYDLLITFEAGSDIRARMGDPRLADTSQNWRPHICFFQQKITDSKIELRAATSLFFPEECNHFKQIYGAEWMDSHGYVEPHVYACKRHKTRNTECITCMQGLV